MHNFPIKRASRYSCYISAINNALVEGTGWGRELSRQLLGWVLFGGQDKTRQVESRSWADWSIFNRIITLLATTTRAAAAPRFYYVPAEQLVYHYYRCASHLDIYCYLLVNDNGGNLNIGNYGQYCGGKCLSMRKLDWIYWVLGSCCSDKFLRPVVDP